MQRAPPPSLLGALTSFPIRRKSVSQQGSHCITWECDCLNSHPDFYNIMIHKMYILHRFVVMFNCLGICIILILHNEWYHHIYWRLLSQIRSLRIIPSAELPVLVEQHRTMALPSQVDFWISVSLTHDRTGGASLC